MPQFRRLQGREVGVLQIRLLSGLGVLEGWAGLQHWQIQGCSRADREGADDGCGQGCGERVVGGWD